MQDIKTTLIGGSCHETDSSEVAFEAAAVIAFENAVRGAEPVLLEPIMKMRVIVPNEHTGRVIGDLNARRARIFQTGTQGTSEVIDADIPLGKTFQYTTELRSMTQGRGSFTMEFSYHDLAPASLRGAILNQRLTFE
jgi:elongation factor G